MSLQNGNLEPLLSKAGEQEKKYEWLQAAKFYRRASDLAFEQKDILKVAQIQEQIGFCYFRSAFQAENNEQFKRRIGRSIEAYQKAIEFFQKTSEVKKTKIEHVKATIFFTSSWIEPDPKKRKSLLYQWWNKSKEILRDCEKDGDLLAAGLICNDLAEYSINLMGLSSDWSETNEIMNRSISFGEKAIKIFSNLNEHYELARAYCFTNCHCTFGSIWDSLEGDRLESIRKSPNYSKHALELSKSTGDAWLISWSNFSAQATARFRDVSPKSAIEYGEKALKYGKIAKDNFLMGLGKSLTAKAAQAAARIEEDPDKQKKVLKKAVKENREAIQNFRIISNIPGLLTSYLGCIRALNFLASIEVDVEKKRSLLESSIRTGRKALKQIEGHPGIRQLYARARDALSLLSKTERRTKQKTKLLQEALNFSEKNIILTQQLVPFSYRELGGSFGHLASLLVDLSKITRDNQKKISLINKAVSSVEKSIEFVEKERELGESRWLSERFGNRYNAFANIMEEKYALTKQSGFLERGIEAYEDAIKLFEQAEMVIHSAESCWRKARLQDKLGKHLEASISYDSAAKKYKIASEKIPQLKEFYQDYSEYMGAWAEIGKAKHNHTKEEYAQAKTHYEKAAELHETSKLWNHLTPNYLALSHMENAEELSRQENNHGAIQAFQQAIREFENSKATIKSRIYEITAIEEKEMAFKLMKSSDSRLKYSHARISIEEAKILSRKGEPALSSKNYGEAAKNIEAIIQQLESEAERKELRLMAVLCHAWQKMVIAEETTSSESYMEAAKLFEQAKDLSVTKKTSLWALGNSSFCKGLAAGINYQSSVDVAEHARAKGLMKSAATSYLRAGFKSASEYAKATQRLFDAYLFMNQAESEADQEKRAKQYQMAEKLLQISAGSFMKAKQPEKTAQVQQMLENVREEKKLAVSLNQVLHAPTIASTTMSFATPTPTSEVSVGLAQFEHANVQANLISGAKEVRVGESFCLSVEFVNAGKEPALLTRVEDFIPSGFIVVDKPEIYRLEDDCLNMKGKQLAPLKLVEAKLVLQPSREGVYQLKPTVYYLDELGQKKSLMLKSLEIKVEEVILADRVSTGTKELDSLLLGGIPEEYAVVLTGPPSDEREKIIKSFLEAGIKKNQITFHVTTEPTGLTDLLEKYPSIFFLFLCNPKPKTEVPDLPNIHKLRSKTDLNNLNIALTVASRSLDQKLQGPKRVCVEIVSDVLIRHQVEVTRRWISGLIAEMSSKGFTLLAVMNPSMHPSDQANAVLDLFDGEISLFETETATECKTSIQTKRLKNQDYIKNPICLTNPNPTL